jgi:hypothetical protein
MLDALKELNFNSLLVLDENIKEYDFNKYHESGCKHKIKGFCTSCEEKGINVCPRDKSFKLTTISHGATTDDILQATGQENIDLADWKKDPVMFVMENPGRSDYVFYEPYQYNIHGITGTKKPSREWYWVNKQATKLQFPQAFEGRNYNDLFVSIIFTFKLRNAYFTNAIKCGMNNENGDFKGTTDYQNACIRNCYENYFTKEIEIIKPKVIFFFGNNAQATITPFIKGKNIPLGVLPHPAAQLQNGYFKHLYYTRILQGLSTSAVGIYTLDEAGNKFKEFLVNYNG